MKIRKISNWIEKKLNNNKVLMQIKSYVVGLEVVFQCRDEGLIRAPVKWIRPGGRPLPPGINKKILQIYLI